MYMTFYEGHTYGVLSLCDVYLYIHMQLMGMWDCLLLMMEGEVLGRMQGL